MNIIIIIFFHILLFMGNCPNYYNYIKKEIVFTNRYEKEEIINYTINNNGICRSFCPINKLFL